MRLYHICVAHIPARPCRFIVFAKTEIIVTAIAKAFAVLGGLVLLALIVLTCLSITGRSLIMLGLNQIEGDFELMEYGAGFAVFCFLPWTQLTAGHARVDLFKRIVSDKSNALLDFLADILMTAAALLLGWRLALGMADKVAYGETSFILQFPVWYAYSAATVAMAAFVVVSLFCVWRSARQWMQRP